jgi:hypothetical protein
VGDLQVEGASRPSYGWLNTGYAHLPRGTLAMFRLDVIRDPSGIVLIAILAHFTNPYDAYSLLDQVFWCGCKFIAFTTYNIFMNFEAIFPAEN